MDHLGGYIHGGDPETFYPDLWATAVRDYAAKSVIDIGCGEGHSLDVFTDLGCSAVGVEGIAMRDARIIRHDYTTGAFRYPPVDLAWSAEFVEHVEERYLPNFLVTFQAARVILMTHAIPNQIGYHHVNCRTGDYWCGVMASAGYALSSRTEEYRRLAGHGYFAATGLVFERNE